MKGKKESGGGVVEREVELSVEREWKRGIWRIGGGSFFGCG
jgi:hypothetical protein